MKCPKCGYLGFEQVDRCRNCGYEFSLSSSSAIQELPVRTDTPLIGPLDDLALDARTDPRPSGVSAEIGPDVDRVFDTAQPPESGPSELPLFGPPTSPISDDTPLITKPSPPRTPLAVRRSTSEVPRARAGPRRAASLDLGLDLDGYPSVAPSPATQAQAIARPGGLAGPVDNEAAGLAARAAAVTLDLLVLGAIDVAVVYFTMQICGVTLQEFAIIPQGPLVAFLVVQNVGYLVAFTAGGQTLGKMAAGIKVVAAESNRSIDVGQALKRTVAWLLLAVPAGLGFLTALASRDRRGLHDRVAGTRVVRASA
jgi:uncharacterized RDD family membrane protein YckC